MEIGARIKEEREKAGLTQERFSELIGLGTKSVSAFERGTVGISFTALKKICQVLSVSSDQILFGQRVENENDLSELSRRLERLSPRQYAIAEEIVLKLLEAFSWRNRKRSKGPYRPCFLLYTPSFRSLAM